MVDQDFDIKGKVEYQSSEEFSEGPDHNTWQEWLMSQNGSEMLCEVDVTYIEDSFHLYGLHHLFSNFQDCMDMILDQSCLSDLRDPVLTENALLLYGLIHSRFIITKRGLDVMLKKYKSAEFGHCPRVLCRGQPVLPYGMTDEIRKCEVRVYCPKCNDVYALPPSVTSYISMKSLDGAFFGTTFTHLFAMTFDKIMPKCSRGTVHPRVFGFKIHSSAQCMQRLRGLPGINFGAPSPLKQQQNVNVVESHNSNTAVAERVSGGPFSKKLANGKIRLQQQNIHRGENMLQVKK